MPDPIPAEYVKFIFEKLAEYAENPPEELVQTIIDSYQEKYGRLLSHDEANSQRLLADYREMIGVETPLSTWKRRVEKMLDSACCIGEMTYYSEVGKMPVRVADHHEPIISRELYASVCEKWKKIV